MIRRHFAQHCRAGTTRFARASFPSAPSSTSRTEHGGATAIAAPVCRNPWIIESFLNGTMAAARRNRETGQWKDLTMAGRSDMAVLRSLRNGRRRLIAVRVLILHEDEGLRRHPATYPDLPRLPREQRAAGQPRPLRASSAAIRMPISASPLRETHFSPRRA